MKTKLTLTITENDNHTDPSTITLESEEALVKVIGAVLAGFRRGLEGPLATPDHAKAIVSVLENEELTATAQRLVGDTAWVLFLEAVQVMRFPSEASKEAS